MNNSCTIFAVVVAVVVSVGGGADVALDANGSPRCVVNGQLVPPPCVVTLDAPTVLVVEKRVIRLSSGALIEVDTDANCLRRWENNHGPPSTYAGLCGGANSGGFVDTPANVSLELARFHRPTACESSCDTIFVADTANNAIRGISSSRVRTVAGSNEGVSGRVDGPALQARLGAPKGMQLNATFCPGNAALTFVDSMSGTTRLLITDGPCCDEGSIVPAGEKEKKSSSRPRNSLAALVGLICLAVVVVVENFCAAVFFLLKHYRKPHSSNNNDDVEAPSALQMGYSLLPAGDSVVPMDSLFKPSKRPRKAKAEIKQSVFDMISERLRSSDVEVVMAGSTAKHTDVDWQSKDQELDVVVLLEGFDPARIDTELGKVASLLTAEPNVEETGRGLLYRKFRIHGIDVDVLVGGKLAPECGEFFAGLSWEDRRRWAPSTVHLAVKFIRDQPELVKDVIRRFKMWVDRDVAKWGLGARPKPCLLELLVVHAHSKLQAADAEKLVLATLKLIKNWHRLDIDFPLGPSYKSDNSALNEHTKNPKIIDPIDPTNNLASTLKCPKDLVDLATRVIDQITPRR